MQREKTSLMTFTLDIDITMKKMSGAECLQMAKNEGIPYVDVMNPSPNRLQAYISAVKETGIQPLCYIGSVSFFSNNEAKIQKAMETHLRAAAAMGAKFYMIVPVNTMKDKTICARLGKAGVQSNLKKYFSLAVTLAEGSGIKVCFETTPQDYTCLSGAEDCRWILEQVPELGLIYDTANMLPHGDDPVAYYEQLKDHIVHTHVKDVSLSTPTWTDHLLHSEWTKDGKVMRCCMSGEGVIPLKEILRRMEQDGYQGTYALEYCHPAKYPADFTENTNQLKKHMKYFEDRN